MVGVNKYGDGSEKDANIPLLRIDEARAADARSRTSRR